MIRTVNMTAAFTATVFTVAMTAAANPQVQNIDPTTGGVSDE